MASPPKSRKRQQQICFRSLAPPTTTTAEEGSDTADGTHGNKYCPHFLAALQLMAHTLVPLRKALVHFYVSYRGKDIDRLEWKTLLAFGRLFRDLITANTSSGGSSAGCLSNGDGSATASLSNHSSEDNTNTDMDALPPVRCENFFAILYDCLAKQSGNASPRDATEALRVLIQVLQGCCRTLPVTNQLWSALLDKACTGLIVKQTLVGLRSKPLGETTDVLVQRTHSEQCILWCPHELPIGDLQRIKTKTIPSSTSENENENESEESVAPTLQQLLEEDCKKRPLSTTNRKPYDFEKQSYDFEVEIPTKFLSCTTTTTAQKDEKEDELWKTTRAMQFASLTGYLFLGIDRQCRDNSKTNNKMDRSQLAIPPTLDLTKLCTPTAKSGKTKAPILYDLVGGALYDEGEYVAVLKDCAAAATITTSDPSDSESDEEPETWKLMEAEETIPMSESDVLEFLKGEGNDEDEDDDDEEGGPCGTLAVYKLRTSNVFQEMDHLLSDIVISQVSGSLDSKTDYYIEEEFYEEIIEDDD